MQQASAPFERNKTNNKGYELCYSSSMNLCDGPVHLAIAFDQTFITPFYVLLTSIFSSNKENKIVFHVIAAGISNEEKTKIKEFVQQNEAVITFYEVEENALPGTELPQSQAYPISIYYRLLFPFLIPETIEKLLYIDTDIVVLNSLSELYHTNIGNLPVGVVLETFVSSRPELGIHEAGCYFNSGVLLMNIPQWKQQKITEKTLHFITNYTSRLIWIDQDALNAILVNNYYSLDFKYNLTTEFIPKDYSRKELHHFIKDKVIIHYTSGGIKKPWSALSKNRLRHVYHYYLKRSPHAFQKKYTDITFSKEFLTEFLKIRASEFLINNPVAGHLWRKAKRLKNKLAMR